MLMDDQRRQRYRERAGLGDQQVRETIGGFTVEPEQARGVGYSDSQTADLRQEVLQVAEDFAVISAYYNQVATDTGRDPREIVQAEDQEADRAALEQAMTKDYRLTGPVGNMSNRAKAIEMVLSGKMRKDGFGRGGFQTMSENLKLEGDAAISTGSFDMEASQLARHRRTGEVQRRRRAGLFHTTHTWVRDNGQWRMAATHISQTTARGQEDDEWEFIHE